MGRGIVHYEGLSITGEEAKVVVARVVPSVDGFNGAPDEDESEDRAVHCARPSQASCISVAFLLHRRRDRKIGKDTSGK